VTPHTHIFRVVVDGLLDVKLEVLLVAEGLVVQEPAGVVCKREREVESTRHSSLSWW
jgi:hypothetical protein